MIKKLARTLFDRLGYEVNKKQTTNSNLESDLSNISLFCQPKTVIDVGVAYGTYSLYEAFPTARFILLEPLKDYEDAIKKIAQKYNCDIHYKAVGNKNETKEITVNMNDLQLTSFAKRTALTKNENQLERRKVEVTTLDTILQESQNMEPPILLKIDTEGHELSVLEGAKSLLEITDTIIAEVSIAKRFEDSYDFEDIILFLKEHGFYLVTFLNIIHPKGELRPRFVDVIFKRRQKTL